MGRESLKECGAERNAPSLIAANSFECQKNTTSWLLTPFPVAFDQGSNVLSEFMVLVLRIQEVRYGGCSRADVMESPRRRLNAGDTSEQLLQAGRSNPVANKTSPFPTNRRARASLLCPHVGAPAVVSRQIASLAHI